MLLLLPLLLFYLSRRRRWTGNRESKKERKKESGREREIVSRLSHVPRLPPRTIVLDSIRVRCLSGAARRGAGGRRRRGEGKSSEKEREKDGARIRGTAPFFNHAYPRYNIISTVWPPPPSSSPLLLLLLSRPTPLRRGERPVPRVSLRTCEQRRDTRATFMWDAHRHAERYNAHVSRGALLRASFLVQGNVFQRESLQIRPNFQLRVLPRMWQNYYPGLFRVRSHASINNLSP